MQPLKIVIALISLIILAIAIGSNLSPIVTVAILSQPTVMLPVGVWFAIAIGLGLLSSSAIQLLVWLQRRTLTKKIRQLQSRLQDVGEDVFSYTPSAPAEPSVTNDRDFQSRTPSPYFTTSPPQPPAIDDNDDWESAPVAKPQAEWEDMSSPLPPPRQQSVKSEQRSTYTQNIVNNDLAGRDGVYDADFRLIQPPYKAPIEEDEDEDEYEYEYDDDDDEMDDDEMDDDDRTPPSHSPTFTKVNDGESEDWGFDFDEKPTGQP